MIINPKQLLARIGKLYWLCECWAWVNGTMALINVIWTIERGPAVHWGVNALSALSITVASLACLFFIHEAWRYSRMYHELNRAIEKGLVGIQCIKKP